MYARTITAALTGLEAEPVSVETDIANGLPGVTIVGLPDLSVREARERIRTALKNAGYAFPMKRITVNLCPGDSRKEGTHFDLPIALSLMAACGYLKTEMDKGWACLGELALDSTIHPVRGALPLAIGLRRLGVRRVLLPDGNLAETALLRDMERIPVRDLAEVVEYLTGRAPPRRTTAGDETVPVRDTISDFADVRGQMPAKRALTIAAAGGHNILLNGPPGSGKTMLAMRLCGIMPEPTDEERLEIAMIASLANKPGTGSGGGGQRPFRQPHHTIPETTMVGGGSRLSPGEVTLAHRGVLFLDEFPEFRRPVLEALRQPLENRRVVVARLAGSAVYPANFLLVAAMNPCPCGYYGDERRVCRCTATQIRRYRERLSGPLLDRIDLRVDLRAVDYRELAGDDGASGTSSVEMSDSRSMRAAVELARAAQRERFPGGEPCVNGQMPPSLTERFCRLDAAGKRLLELAFHKYRLSARSYQKVLKVARTIADLEGEKTVRAENLAEALRYRVEQVHED